jgi:hypothetical protein
VTSRWPAQIWVRDQNPQSVERDSDLRPLATTSVTNEDMKLK